ncbi:reverse transcriptase domain-containing protein [Tanacetum coccineum]
MDQEKTTFTCPFGTYAYRRMSFGLCNALATFQRCMLAIFHDMIEESVEVFMDDFSVFGNSFDKCLNNLDKMLQRCKDAHLVLNWKKCHFMVKEGIMLGHKVSGTALEVDKAKIDVISKLPPLNNIKGVRSFLGHAGFYRRFIKDFSKIARPLTKLLEKDTPFEFNDECQKAFKLLKEKLTCAPVIVSPNWNPPFELMCDASDFAVRVVLGQKDRKTFIVNVHQLKLYHEEENYNDQREAVTPFFPKE